jgi:sugar diacid utilization regulator
MAGLQTLVDSLNRRLQCAVVIDCVSDNQQFYNARYGQMDQSRVHRLLTRAGTTEAAAYFRPYRTPLPESPVRVPANAQLGIDSRIYMPVQHDGAFLAHLWVFDPEARLGDAELETVRAAAEAAGLILSREQLIADLDRSRERELLRDLLSADARLRTQAAQELVAFDLFIPATAVTALVVQPVNAEMVELDEQRRRDIARALDEVRSGLTPGHVLHLVRNDHGLIVLAMKEPGLRSGGVSRVAGELRETLLDSLAPDDGWQVLIGIGDPQPTLAESSASYEQARDAIRVAGVAPIFAPVAEWSQLGIYRLLSRFPLDELSVEKLHPGLQRLLEQDDGGLVQTLECYLDCGCDAKKSSALLFVHRGTLYYRLRKIEALTGTDLTTGEDRLALHLSLRLARLTRALAER